VVRLPAPENLKDGTQGQRSHELAMQDKALSSRLAGIAGMPYWCQADAH
jgi:hypothetical protein